MNVRVCLFARAKDLVGVESVTLSLAAGATIGDLRQRLVKQYPSLALILERSALAVNDEFADDSLTLPVDSEIAVLPPVSGGASI
jgi:molybdopterin converting factor subunit 1